MGKEQTDVKSRLAAKAGTDTDAKPPMTMAQSIGAFLDGKKHELAMAVPGYTEEERRKFTQRLLRLAQGTISRTPKLAACTKTSLITGIVISTQLGLELNTPLGHAYLVPYSRSIKTASGWGKVDEAQFQIGYQGIIDLAYRTGMYSMIYAEPVYANDDFSYTYGLHKTLHHVPTAGDSGELIGVYACYHLKTGGSDFKYWPVSKIHAHAKKYSKSWDEKNGVFFKGSAWAEHFESMARVPVLKDCLKLAPKSIEFAKQLTLDGSTKAQFAADMSEVQNLEDGDMVIDTDDYVVTMENGSDTTEASLPD